MSHHPDDKRSAVSAAAGKPSLETLLRLKRAERPDAAFWEEFDRGLQRKQLAAIIEPRPWWLGLAILGRRLAPAGLPVSAAAAALFAMMVMRTQVPFGAVSGPVEFGPDLPPAQPVAAAGVVASTAPERPTSSPEAHTRVTALQPELFVAANPPSAHDAAVVKPAERPMLAATVAPAANPPRAAVAPLVPALLELPPLVSAPEPTASQLAIARNLAVVRSESPELLPSVGGALSASAESADSAESLQMVVRNPRHARVLLAMADSGEVESSAGLGQVRDRLAHRLGSDETRLGSASRLGVGGDRFSLSF